MQWALQQGLPSITVVSVDTGWAGEGWLAHVERAERWVREQGYATVRLLASPDFETLMQRRQDFPSTKFQWCANVLKGATILQWLDKVDPALEYQILLGHRRASARSKQNLPEKIEQCDKFGDRTVIYPLVNFSTEARDALIKQTNFPILSHRSLECDPCVNSTLVELKQLPATTYSRLVSLETKIGKKLFDFSEKNTTALDTTFITDHELDVLENMGCGDYYGCGI